MPRLLGTESRGEQFTGGADVDDADEAVLVNGSLAARVQFLENFLWLS
jgi:hypothetical protein